MTDYTPPEALVERATKAMCKSRGTAQCAAICLSHSSNFTTNGECPEAKSVWGRECRAALAATPLGELVEALERLSRMLPAVLHGERDVVDLREIIDAAIARAKGETP